MARKGLNRQKWVTKDEFARLGEISELFHTGVGRSTLTLLGKLFSFHGEMKALLQNERSGSPAPRFFRALYHSGTDRAGFR